MAVITNVGLGTYMHFGRTIQFQKEHIEGAINIPLFRPVTGTGFWDNLKKGVMRFGLAMVATGVNSLLNVWFFLYL
jgi:hypothetical protein